MCWGLCFVYDLREAGTMQGLLRPGVIRTGTQNSREGAGNLYKHLILLKLYFNDLELYALPGGGRVDQPRRITPAVAMADLG